jgi:hypothetical protein
MATIKVHGGDFVRNSTGYLNDHDFRLPTAEHRFLRIALAELVKISMVNQEAGQTAAAAFGRALVGELLLGPLGALARSVSAAHRTHIRFAATFVDGRRLLATTDSAAFNRLMGFVFTRKSQAAKQLAVSEHEERVAMARVDEMVARHLDRMNAKPAPCEALPSARANGPTFGKRRQGAAKLST